MGKSQNKKTTLVGSQSNTLGENWVFVYVTPLSDSHK